MRKIIVLGDGQVWNVKGIDPQNPNTIFEDLFSGRALGERAAHFDNVFFRKFKRKIFEKYKEKGKSKLTGISLTRALRNRQDTLAQESAEAVLKDMAVDAARGIIALTKGRGHKRGWSKKERSYWKDLSGVIIGAGVSKGKTGNIIIKTIENYLHTKALSSIKIFKAKFPGKEAGFLGAVADVADLVLREAHKSGLERVGIIGLDLGRTGIGAGIVVINPKTGNIIKANARPWIFRYSIKTHGKNKIEDYTGQKAAGLDLRNKIMEQFVRLILMAKKKLQDSGLPYTRHIAVALPGQTTKDGYLVGSTHYLPFFKKQDGFHFTRELENRLKGKGYFGLCIHIVNDGIAAGLANLRFGIGLENLCRGKYAFLGPGSGLGGCVCKIAG